MDKKFPRSLRVLRSSEFNRIKAQGEKISFHALTFYFLKRKDETTHTRLGITVSKKVSKKAVIRNSIKRKIREVFRTMETNLLPLGHDISIIAREDAVLLTTEAISTLFAKAVKKKC